MSQFSWAACVMNTRLSLSFGIPIYVEWKNIALIGIFEYIGSE